MQDEEKPPAASDKQPTLHVHAQFIKDISFENPNPFKYFQHTPSDLDTAVDIEVKSNPLDGGYVEILLKINAKTCLKGGDQDLDTPLTAGIVYLLEVVYGGVFTVAMVPPEYEKFFLFVEAPRVLFPFARALVAHLVQESGFPPLLLKPVDFSGLLRQQVKPEVSQITS